MKTLLYPLFAVACVMPMTSHALDLAQASALDLRAQEAYAAGDHAQALLLFDTVATVYGSAALEYNIGNCHFKLGDIPRAILHYERALRLEPGAEDIRANLDMARQQVADRMNELPGFALGATWGRLRGGRDVDQWARRALWAGTALFLALTLALLTRVRWIRPGALALAGALLITTLLSVTFAAIRAAEVRDDSAAIIMSPKVDVRSEPNISGTVLFVLHKGSKVSVQQEDRNGWTEVRLPNGSVGWMPPGTLERI